MTDWTRLQLAALWRHERIDERLTDESSISGTHDLAAERERLHRFAEFCALSRRFRGGGRR